MLSRPLSLPKKILRRAFLVWEFFSHSTYNYQTLQGAAFGHALAPVFRALYPDKAKAGAKTKKHMGFFNTEPCFGLLIHGVTIHLEEQQAQGAPVSDETISTLKSNLMGPLAGFGDAVTQGMLVPLGLALALAAVLGGALWPPLLYVLVLSAVMVGLGYVMWMRGYQKGPAAITQLLSGGKAQKLVAAAKVLGCMVLGGLLAQCIVLPLPVPAAAQPWAGCAAALGLSLALYALMKKLRPNLLIYALILLGGALGAGGLFPVPIATAPHALSWWQCLLLGALYFFSHSSFASCIAFVTISRPVWSGFVVGLVLGDVATGAVMGAYLQLMYLCFIGVGGAMPTDINLAGYAGVAVSMALGLPPQAALALCFLVGRLGSVLWPLRMRKNAVFAQRAAACAGRADFAGITRWHVFASQGLLALLTVLPAALLIGLLALLPCAALWPRWLLAAVQGASLLLPCVGVASNLRSLTADRRAWPFFFAGVALSLVGLDVWLIALVSLPVAYLVYRRRAQV